MNNKYRSIFLKDLEKINDEVGGGFGFFLRFY